MSDGDVSPNHLSEEDVLERLVPYLAAFDEPKHPLANLTGKKDKKKEVNLKEVVSIFESKRSDSGGAATGWCLLDDDGEICMIDEVGKSKLRDLSRTLDLNPEDASMSWLLFARPRMYKIYSLQWQRVMSSGNAQSVRFNHNGKELYSHMHPFMWRDGPPPVIPTFRGVSWGSQPVTNTRLLKDMGIHRSGRNRLLKYGERMNKCVMHSVSHYSQCENIEEDMLEDHKGIKYIANH
jgi:hypothetical protein